MWNGWCKNTCKLTTKMKTESCVNISCPPWLTALGMDNSGYIFRQLLLIMCRIASGLAWTRTGSRDQWALSVSRHQGRHGRHYSLSGRRQSRGRRPSVVRQRSLFRWKFDKSRSISRYVVHACVCMSRIRQLYRTGVCSRVPLRGPPESRGRYPKNFCDTSADKQMLKHAHCHRGRNPNVFQKKTFGTSNIRPHDMTNNSMAINLHQRETFQGRWLKNLWHECRRAIYLR